MSSTLSFLNDPDLSRNLFFPRRESSPPPPGAHDTFLEVAPSVRLHARLHAAPAALATVVLFHGNGELVADYDEQAPLFAHAGARLVVIDYRGYGRSDGLPSLATLLTDARPTLEQLRPQLEHDTPSARPLPLIVMGRSLGSVCAAELAGVSPPLVAGIIFESGFSDLVGFAARRGLAGHVTAADREALCPLHKLARSQAPLLVLHGEEDHLIDSAEGRAAYDASGSRQKQLAIIPGRGHNDLSLDPRYWSTLVGFVTAVAADVTAVSSDV